MKTITRNWIREDAEFFSVYDNGIDSYSKKDLCEFIDYWKEFLLFNGAKKGDKIGIAIEHTDIHYTAIMFASFELGLRYVTLYKATVDKELSGPKVNAFLPLDFLIYWSSLAEHPKFSVSMNYYRNKANVSIGYDYRFWKLNSNKFRSKNVTPVLAEPDDPIILLQTSGTTGVPKQVEHTHKTLYELCSVNWEDLGYKKTDNVLNVSSLNHGGSISIFQLPSLHICKNTYFVSLFAPNGDTSDRLYQNCKKYNITKFTSAHGGIVDSLISRINQNEGLKDLEFIILTFISPKWIEPIKDGKIKQVSSAFGSTETCGPLFISKLNKDNIESFNPRFLGNPIEKYHSIDLKDKFEVTMKNGNKVLMEDVLDVKPEGVYFVRKQRLKKINDIDINPIDIYNILELYTSRYKVEVYIDEIYNELYILTCDMTLNRKVLDDIENIYAGQVKVKELLYVPELQDFIVAVKADSEKIEEYINKVCRGR